MILHYVLKNKDMIEVEWQKRREELSQFDPQARSFERK